MIHIMHTCDYVIQTFNTYNTNKNENFNSFKNSIHIKENFSYNIIKFRKEESKENLKLNNHRRVSFFVIIISVI